MGFEFLSIDPGRSKCGLAVMNSDGEVIARGMAAADGVAEAAQELTRGRPGVDRMVLGGGTGRNEVAERLRAAEGLPARLEIIAEKNTTLEALRVYDAAHPLPWPIRFIPRSMFSRPPDVDSYAAVVIGRRYLDQLQEKK